jgi:anti-anti-sigma factor
MELGFENVSDVLVVTPVGRLDSNTAPEAEKAILSRIDGGENRVVMDFSSLSYISSAGLRVVLVAAKRLRKTNGAFTLFGMNESIHEVFQISGFLSLLSVLENRTAAIEAASAAGGKTRV